MCIVEQFQQHHTFTSSSSSSAISLNFHIVSYRCCESPALDCIAVQTTMSILIKLYSSRWYEWILWGNNCFRRFSFAISLSLPLSRLAVLASSLGHAVWEFLVEIWATKKFPRTFWSTWQGGEMLKREKGPFLLTLSRWLYWHDSEFTVKLFQVDLGISGGCLWRICVRPREDTLNYLRTNT